ncbi:MAG: YdeI/OmpD-associated family protein [Candidatus Staskawiczbacteria bacterium]|nr:YdeI/OmpD-associated family protein [Candidatus Staskawiczbacteria bacterium]MBI3337022.1 YdeI/OmpD-associated family protein [Candidatus Staskawiczbacteria bacterium]
MVRLSHHKFATGVAHKVPADLRKYIISTPLARTAWDSITPLARNEWICWIESAKKNETRSHRIERTRNELIQGKRRPCCWAGCIHR